MAIGTVREWHDEDGWGVLDSDLTPGGCWFHFSSVVSDGPRVLAVGQEVTFAWEEVEQDGYACRAQAVWLSTGAYHSSLRLDGRPATPAEREQLEHGGLVVAARARAAALATNDAENLLRLLHPDFTWTSHRGEVLDRASYVRGNTDGSLTWLEQRLEEVRTRIVGDTGVLTCVAHDRVVRDGVELTFTMPVTQTWVREQHQWRCLAGHAGPLHGD
jgi:cold shock CspA family protein